MGHVITRTSPKGPGKKFIGKCINCGKENLTIDKAMDDCPSSPSLEIRLKQAIDGDQ